MTMDSSETSSDGTPTLPRVATTLPIMRGVYIIVVVLLIPSFLLNVLLAGKVRSLNRSRSAEITRGMLTIGTIVPPITARLSSGQTQTIDFASSDRPTVLYIFTPTCLWCERNLENIKALLQAKDSEYRFIGLSLSREALAPYLVTHELHLPTYTDLEPTALDAYKVHGTPQTLVVSPQGRVIQNWTGAYVGEQKTQVEGFFHVSLPGIRPSQNSR